MHINVSDLMGLPVVHTRLFVDNQKNLIMFETIDKDNQGDTARWRLIFTCDTGKVISDDSSTQQAFSNWTI